MDGELIEKEIIKPYKKYEYDVEGLFTFDIDTVQLMMSEKGYAIKYYTVDRIRSIFDEWKEKVEELIYSNPVFEVLKEYKELFYIAYHNDLLSPVINATDDAANSSHDNIKISILRSN